MLEIVLSPESLAMINRSLSLCKLRKVTEPRETDRPIVLSAEACVRQRFLIRMDLLND